MLVFTTFGSNHDKQYDPANGTPDCERTLTGNVVADTGLCIVGRDLVLLCFMWLSPLLSFNFRDSLKTSKNLYLTPAKV